MKGDQIEYREGYKYQLVEDYAFYAGVLPAAIIDTKFLNLTPDGWLLIRAGYAWDGPSGPAIDTANAMRASLVHDAFYQLLREGLLPQVHRITADRLYKAICLEAGMIEPRAWAHYRALVAAGGAAADPANRKPILTAP